MGIDCFSRAGFDKLGGFQKDKKAEMLEGIPLLRFGSKWDIAMACIYLASRSAPRSFRAPHLDASNRGAYSSMCWLTLQLTVLTCQGQCLFGTHGLWYVACHLCIVFRLSPRSTTDMHALTF